MKKIIVSLIAIVIAMIAPEAMAQTDSPMSLSFEGKTLTVKIKGNATTGFSWKYTTEDESVIKYVSDQYVTNDNGGQPMVGVGGVHTFVFEGASAGSTKISFKYGRPWQGGETAETRFVKVKVTSDGEIKKAKETKK